MYMGCSHEKSGVEIIQSLGEGGSEYLGFQGGGGVVNQKRN